MTKQYRVRRGTDIIGQYDYAQARSVKVFAKPEAERLAALVGGTVEES